MPNVEQVNFQKEIVASDSGRTYDDLVKMGGQVQDIDSNEEISPDIESDGETIAIDFRWNSGMKQVEDGEVDHFIFRGNRYKIRSANRANNRRIRVTGFRVY